MSRAELVGLSLAVEPGEGVYLPLAHVDAFRPAMRRASCRWTAVIDRLRAVASDPSMLKIGHDIKYHMRACSSHLRRSS